MKRSSFVDTIKVNSLQFSSIIQLGDSTIIQGGNRALAVQREEEIFWGQEGSFSPFSVFSEEIPLPEITEKLSLEVNNSHSAAIKVGSIDILGISAASLVHVGNSKNVRLEARIKHIRHLLK